jgi:anti-anti-sigma factor
MPRSAFPPNRARAFWSSVVLTPDAQPTANDSELLVIGPSLWARVRNGVMTFHGDIDLVTERQFRCTVTTQARRAGGQLVVDFTALNFLDSGGIGALYAMAKDPEIAISVRVASGSIVDRVLVFSGMDRILPIERVEPGVPPTADVA